MSSGGYHFGKRLAAAREAKKLSVQEAAHATRMRVSYIEALENSMLTGFANAAYAKSFLLMYAKYLGVDVSDAAESIDTRTQVGVGDFQYLSSRAEHDKTAQKAAADSRYDFVVPRRESRSWMPLVASVAIAALAGGILMVWMNVSRVSDDRNAFQRQPSSAKPDSAAAVKPVEAPIAKLAPAPGAPSSTAQTPPVAKPVSPAAINPGAVTANPPTPAGSNPPTVSFAAPRPNIVGAPSGTVPSAAPVTAQAMEDPSIPRAKPISPVASIAANDSALLADIPVAAKPAATPPPASVVSVNQDDSDVVLLEPRKKTWVVIRSGPGGQPLFEDYLYPSVRPMRLAPGKYYIELREADAVAIVRNGKRISYVAPGVLVQ